MEKDFPLLDFTEFPRDHLYLERKDKMENSKIFIPHELKTVEIDVEKKIFRVNGEDFGKNCKAFAIWGSSDNDSSKDWFNVEMEVDSSLSFSASYSINGEKTSDKSTGTVIG